jgi:hypothetical protein
MLTIPCQVQVPLSDPGEDGPATRPEADGKQLGSERTQKDTKLDEGEGEALLEVVASVG